MPFLIFRLIKYMTPSMKSLYRDSRFETKLLSVAFYRQFNASKYYFCLIRSFAI